MDDKINTTLKYITRVCDEYVLARLNKASAQRLGWLKCVCYIRLSYISILRIAALTKHIIIT